MEKYLPHSFAVAKSSTKLANNEMPVIATILDFACQAFCSRALQWWKHIFNVRMTGLVFFVFAGLAAPASAQDGYQVLGVVVSKKEALLSSPLTAPIKYLEVELGDSVSFDDVLVKFDCARFEADHRSAKSAAESANAKWHVNRELSAYNAIGSGSLKVSRADAAAAKARAEALAEVVEDCEIKAPFGGRIAERLVNNFEMAKEGEPILRLIDHNALAIELIVPSVWLAWLEIGAPLHFQVIETGEEFDASVDKIAASVDPVSQTITIQAGFQELPAGVLAGMSGRATFAGPGT